MGEEEGGGMGGEGGEKAGDKTNQIIALVSTGSLSRVVGSGQVR